MHWKRKWQPTSVFLLGESQGWGSLAGCRLRGRTESDTTSDLAAAAAAVPPGKPNHHLNLQQVLSFWLVEGLASTLMALDGSGWCLLKAGVVSTVS